MAFGRVANQRLAFPEIAKTPARSQRYERARVFPLKTGTQTTRKTRHYKRTLGVGKRGLLLLCDGGERGGVAHYP